MNFSDSKPRSNLTEYFQIGRIHLATGLRVRSTAYTLAEPLIRYLPDSPLAIIRHGEGIIGFGEVARLSATGPNRIAELARQWAELVGTAEVDDQVQLPGSGLVAFGSFAFSGDSASESVLIVPRTILGVRDGRGWITQIGDESATVAPAEAASARKIELLDGSPDPAGYEKAVSLAVDAIKQNHLEKVVLARTVKAQVGAGFDLRPALAKLAENYPGCWTYAVDGTFGASPELLVRVSHGQVATRVLAGTAARGETEAENREVAERLRTSEKDLAEHKMAVDSVTGALASLTARLDFDEKPFAVEFPNLWHLASDVHAVLAAGVSGLDLVAALHPTAAVAGTPRDAALDMIAKLEPFDRGRYAGPVGWISSSGDCEWLIALRGGQLRGDTITAYAGCGVVAESVPAQELAETNLKFRPVREALG